MTYKELIEILKRLIPSTSGKVQDRLLGMYQQIVTIEMKNSED